MNHAPEMVFPDYAGGSIVNLMSSIEAALGSTSHPYTPLRGLDPEQLSAARNLVLLVIDGLGYEFLTQAGRGSVLLAHLQQRITSVAPPTTATAITTFLTGLAPQQHGLTGWYTYFRELGSVLAVLPFTARYGGEPLGHAGISARSLFGHQPLFDRLDVTSYSLSPAWIAHSDFNRDHLGSARLVAYDGLDQCCSEIVRVVRSHDRRKYVYAYWPRLDQLAHRHGIESAEVSTHLAELDAGFTHLLEALAGTDTLLLVTADHGIVDISDDGMIRLEQHPELKACLGVPLCGEQRMSYAYVRRGKRESFEDYLQRHLSGVVKVYRSEELLDQNLFGEGEPHPELAARIGDYILVMADGHVIKDRLPGERPHAMRGYHGGLSAREMYVPLILVSTQA